MSQATQSLPRWHQLSAYRIAVVSALLALLATAAVVLVLAIDGGATQTSAPAGQSTHPAYRSDGGPEESATAASVGSRTGVGPDESSIAATIGSAGEPAPAAGRPDENKIAATVGSNGERP